MGIGTRMFRLGAVLPGIVLSAALTLVVSATLPPGLGGLLLVAYVWTAMVLAFGRSRPSGSRAWRRPWAKEGEEQLLQALGAQLRTHGGGVPDLYVARNDLGRAAAEPCGRRSVVVAPRMLGWLHREQVSQALAAAIVAQAAAAMEVGPARFDLAVRLLTTPGAVMVAMFHRVARLFTWVPGVLGLWRIRAVFGVVAVWQCLESRQATTAVTTGALMAMSYTAPACARAWRRRVEVEADRMVATAGLGDQLVFAVRSADEAGCVDRVHRIRKAAQEAGRTPTAEPGRRSLYLVQ